MTERRSNHAGQSAEFVKLLAQLGRRLRQRREGKELGQISASRRAGMSLSHFQKCEHGANDFRMSTLFRLAQLLDVSPAELLAGLELTEPRRPSARALDTARAELAALVSLDSGKKATP